MSRRTWRLIANALSTVLRYLWTSRQIAAPDAAVANGIRTDVAAAPKWMREEVEAPLLRAGIVAQGFTNSFASNIYHDGTEGLSQHYDDDRRFLHPVVSLRLYSDSRLSFGCKLYGYCNGTVTVPMPRGSVCVLLPDGWAGSKVKHAIRPQDMEGKSGVVLLRHIHEELIRSGDELKLSDLADLFAAASLEDGPWSTPVPQAQVPVPASAVAARAPALPDPLLLAEEAGLRPLATAEDLERGEVARWLRRVLVKALRSRWRQRSSNSSGAGAVSSAVGAVGVVGAVTPWLQVKRAPKPVLPAAAALIAARQERQEDERIRSQVRALLDQLVSALERSAGDAEGAVRMMLGDQRRAITMHCRWVLRRIVDTIVREAGEAERDF